MTAAPDLQQWLVQYGGFGEIDWPEWDRLNGEYQAKRREVMADELEASKRMWAALLAKVRR